MSIEQTLSIIKPDAVGKNVIGKIMDRFESAGLKIVACRMMHLSREQAEVFYSAGLVAPITSRFLRIASSPSKT